MFCSGVINSHGDASIGECQRGCCDFHGGKISTTGEHSDHSGRIIPSCLRHARLCPPPSAIISSACSSPPVSVRFSPLASISITVANRTRSTASSSSAVHSSASSQRRRRPHGAPVDRLGSLRVFGRTLPFGCKTVGRRRVHQGKSKFLWKTH